MEYNLQWFAKEGNGGEKTEPATSKKLQDARNEGQVAKSQELNSALSLIALFVTLKLFISYIGESLLQSFPALYRKIPDVIDESIGGMSVKLAVTVINNTLGTIVKILLPVFLIGYSVALLTNIVQVGWKVTAKPMKPKFSKLNPLSGFKRIFSKDSLFELLKSIAKISLIIYVAYTAIRDHQNELFLVYDIPLLQVILLVGSIAIDAGLKISQYDSNGEYTDWVSRPNNVKDFFQTGVSMNHMVSVQAKGENVTTRASLSYRDQKGTVPNTDQKKYSGQVNTDMKLNKYISFNLSASYTRTKSDNLIGQGYGSNNPINSLVAWTGRQINMQTLKDNWNQRDANGDYTYYNWIDAYHMNPYFTANVNTNSLQRDRIFGKSSLFYQPFDWLKFEGRIGMDYYNMQTFERHYFDRGDWPEGAFYQQATKNTELNADFIATVNKTFGDFNLSGVLGANYRDLSWETSKIGADALTVRGVYTMANAKGTAVATMDHSHIRSNSIYANASLGWKSQLYLDASARNDWSSTIHDSFFYPSVSLSWIPTASFENLQNDILTFWKLRGGIAQIGSATSAYRNSYYYYAESSSYNGVAQMYKSYTYPNYGLKPESITTWEVGTEVGLFDDRLHFDLAYYQKQTKDQILSVSTSNVVGFAAMLVNAGRIDNKGVELQVRGDIFRSKGDGFNWSTTLNFAKDRSKVVELYNDPETGKPLLESYGMGWTWGIDTQARVGEKWGALVGEGYARVSEEDVAAGKATADQIGAIKLYTNGTPQKEASKIIGNVTPDFLMGWRHDFTYKNFGFGFLLDLRIGGDIWSQTMSHSYSAGVANVTAENGIRERAIVAGKDVMTEERFVIPDASGKFVENNFETDAYTWFNSNGNAETYVFDGSFLKLREAYISYDVPKSFLKKTKYFNRATVSLIGTNLALLWVHSSNKLRLDPETGGVSSDSRGVGFEQASTPNSRSIGFKLGLTF